MTERQFSTSNPGWQTCWWIIGCQTKGRGISFVNKATAINGDRGGRGLEASSNLAGCIGHPGKDIRPCIACLLETPLTKGEPPNRNVAALIIATEFLRIGLDNDAAQARLEDWNNYNSPPLRFNELIKALTNGYSGKYLYGCGNIVLQGFCSGRDVCQFNIHVRTGKPKHNDLVFVDYGWPRYLSNRQTLIYSVALPFLEKKRCVGRGGLICANHKQIAQTCGISPGRVGTDLKILGEVGLIDYNVGRPRKWEGIASEIRRVFPIPHPSRESIKIMKGFKNVYPSN